MFAKVTLIGNVGRDPEVFDFKSGGDKKEGVKFSLAVTDGYGDKKTTTWYSIVAYNGLVKVVKDYVSKGKSLFLEGRIALKSYKNKDDETVSYIEVTADTLKLLGGKSEGGSKDSDSGSSRSSSSSSKGSSNQRSAPVEDDDVPF